MWKHNETGLSDQRHGTLHATLRRSSLHQALLVPWETAHPQADWVHRPGCGSWKVRRYEKADHTVGDVVTWVVLEVMPHSHHAPGAWRKTTFYAQPAASILPFVAMMLALQWGCCWSSCWRSSQGISEEQAGAMHLTQFTHGLALRFQNAADHDEVLPLSCLLQRLSEAKRCFGSFLASRARKWRRKECWHRFLISNVGWSIAAALLPWALRFGSGFLLAMSWAFGDSYNWRISLACFVLAWAAQ